MSAIKDARSGTDNSNLQEIIDAAVSAKHALMHGQNQYQTPEWLARACAALLPRDSYGLSRWVTDGIVDPQGAEGNLVKAVTGSRRIVFELDNRLKSKSDDDLFRITGNCVRIGELMDELYPRTTFACIVANPPFGIRWKTKDGSVDSTEWTWEFIKKRLTNQGFGFIISNVETLKRIGADVAESTYLFQEFPAGGIWDNCNVKLGIAHFHRAGIFPGKRVTRQVWDHVPSEDEIKALYPELVIRQGCVPYGYPNIPELETLRNIINDERADRPPFNVYLGKDGTLKTYLSTYSGMKMKRDDIAALHRLQNCHPLSLTVEKELRTLLQHTIDSGVYILEPAAKQAIKDALQAVKSQGCPIRPVTDFELIAYGDDHDDVECDNPTPLRPGMKFTKGKRYDVKTATYTFQDAFVKKVLTFGEDESECWMEDHDMTLHGQDRFTEVFDDNNRRWRFMDRPPASQDWCLNESLFWAIFKKPDVPTVAETMPDFYERNRNILGLHATMSGFQYFPGQHDYIARLGCKDYALVGADVGTGKTLIALSLIQLKSPSRTLIIAPQGTMRSSGDEDDVDYQPSQWITEIRRFAPGEPVFQLFSREDYAGILNANGGEFPPGIYVTYPQAYWQNGSFDHIPESWQKKHPEKLFRKMFGLPWDDENPPPSEEWFNRGVGSDKNGIRCVVKPSLAITIAAEQPEWDMVCVDEAHLCFPYSTEVVTREFGAIPIGRIVEEGLDVEVLSCNLRLDVTQWKRVAGRFKNPANRALVRVTHDHGSFVCTDDHKIRVGGRWKEAKSLNRGEELQVLRHSVPGSKKGEKNAGVLLKDVRVQGMQFEAREKGGHLEAIQEAGSVRHENVRAVQKSVHVPMVVPENRAHSEVLREKMLGRCEGRKSSNDSSRQEGFCPALGEPTGREESRVVGANEEEQSHEESRGAREDAPKPSGTDLPRPRRERRAHQAAIAYGEPTELADGGGDTYSTSTRPLPITSELLQSGHRESRTEAGDRGGWEDPQTEEVEVSGPPQRERPEVSRVVSVEIIQQRGGIPDGRGRGMDHVYCIEVEDNHNFFADGVLVSNCANLGSQVTQNLLRLQPKFRYALTATPIPNFVNNLFSLMGWLCVPDWYKGDKLNVAWPYKIDDEGKFKTTFMCTEVDKTVQDRAKQKNDRGWSKKGVKKSPTISSPARLLKILKPNLAYISKEECNPKQVTCDVIDVRVPLGADQQIIYEHWLNRENLRKEFPNPLTRALAQLQRLRGVCASPASTRYRTINRGTVLEPKMFTCHSDFNAKTVTVLQLIRDRLVEGEQVVIVSARCGQSTELQRRLREAGIPTARIDSTVSAEMHTAEANRFKRGDARVMFMGIKCAQGHSFDQCRNLIIGSLEWSYGSLHQAKGRVWRLTSKQQVRVWCVLHENTIEELLFDRVATKQDAATICLHGKRVPRAYHQADASEVLGEHIVNYKASDGKIMSEAECESQWPELRRQLVLAFNPKAIAA